MHECTLEKCEKEQYHKLCVYLEMKNTLAGLKGLHPSHLHVECAVILKSLQYKMEKAENSTFFSCFSESQVQGFNYDIK